MENRYGLIFTNLSSLSGESGIFDDKNNFFVVLNDIKGKDLPEERENVIFIEDTSLQSIAPCVIKCAEVFGMINRVAFLPFSSETDSAFLDISEDSFVSYQGLVSALFFLCKCSLPYMLAAETPEIIIPVEENPSGITKRIFKTTLLSFTEEIKKELSDYNIAVKAPLFTEKLNIRDYL